MRQPLVPEEQSFMYLFKWHNMNNVLNFGVFHSL